MVENESDVRYIERLVVLRGGGMRRFKWFLWFCNFMIGIDFSGLDFMSRVWDEV